MPEKIKANDITTPISLTARCMWKERLSTNYRIVVAKKRVLALCP